jgi:hypothetical protein
MATGSSAFTGGEKPILAPYVIDMPLVSKYPTPKDGWEGSTQTDCPRCKERVWINESLKKAMNQLNVLAMCENCAKKERDRQSKG